MSSSSYSIYSNASLAPSLPLAGYWGPPTASVDWCENNYDISYYIAEFFNTFSSLSLIVAGLAGMYLHRTFEKRFIITFGSLTIVGLGSVAFHGTLLFPLQMLDELPMVYAILALTYCCIEDRPYRRYGTWFPVGIALYGLLTTIVMLFAGPDNHLLEFVVFQSSFACAVLTVISRIIKMYQGIEDADIKHLWKKTALVFAASYLFWNIDFRLCDVMQTLPLGLWNPQLHAVWHVGAAVCSYMSALLVCHNRSENMGRRPVMRWKLGLLPYVVENHTKST